MTWYSFSLLLVLLLVSCALCSATSTDSGIELFKAEHVEALTPNGASHEKFDAFWFGFPSLVLANNVMVGHVRVGVGNPALNILTKYIGTGEDGWAEKAYNSGKNWESQWALESPINGITSSVSVAKNDTIHILYAVKARIGTPGKQLDFRLSTGKVTHGSNGAISIVWKNEPVKESSTKDIQTNLDNVNLFHGFGFVMKDETFVFVFTGEYTNSRKVFMIAHSEDPSTDLTFHFDDETAPNCVPKIFSWEEKLFMFPIRCNDATEYKLRESNDMGKTWRESSGKLAEDLKGRLLTDTYTPITIGEKRLLLFTQAQKRARTTYDVMLFAAYNNSIHSLGFIFTVSRGVIYGSLLYTKGELFYLFTQKHGSQNNTLFRLTKHLEKMKELLDDQPPVSGSEQARSIMEENSVHLHINVAVVLLCVLFGMWAPISF